MNTDPVIRLHLFFARENAKAVILRQGPSKMYRMFLWDRKTNQFEDGQWLNHKVYVERCDLSPDGQHFIYFALDGRWDSDTKGSYTAISRPPFFTALALFPVGDTWSGGGRFINNSLYEADGNGDIIERADGLQRVSRVPQRKTGSFELRLANGDSVPLPPEKNEVILGRVKQPVAKPLDLYDTQGGCLYRRKGHDMTLIRDFTDMAFEPIRAPYDWRDEETKDPETQQWHPLQGEESP